MLDPTIPTNDGLDNRYMLASIIGKRAVQIMKGSAMLTDCHAENTVTIAIDEYKHDKLAYIKK